VVPAPSAPPDLAPEREIEEFQRLQTRLSDLWRLVFPRDDQAYTSVVVPSLTLDGGELAKLHGATFYEERLLFLLIRLRNPHARLVYVTSQPIHPQVLDYYLEMLSGIPASHARSRLTLLCAYDGSPQPLTQKILQRPRLIERIRTGLGDPRRAYLTVFNSTPLERRLAVRLGIPLNGVDPELTHLGTKSGSRKVFREAGVECPEGMEDLRSEKEVEDALVELRDRCPRLRRAVVKLDQSFSGEGNAIFRYPSLPSREAVRDSLHGLEFAVPGETRVSYFEKLSRMGGVVEELLEAPEVASPSVQMRINPLGEVTISSTHEQVLGGRNGQIYLGCVFPAADDYRLRLHDAGLKVGHVLAAKGVMSRFSVDFLVRRDGPGGGWSVSALEINLRMGGTTHPMLALRFLTDGKLDPTGLFISRGGVAKYYRATDNLCSDAYRGLAPEDLVDILTVNHLSFSRRSETGILFHMIGAMSEFGKVGMMAIGNDRREADATYTRAVDVLDRESANVPPARPPSRRPPGLSGRAPVAAR
jgi:PGM1 C-terminal domain